MAKRTKRRNNRLSRKRKGKSFKGKSSREKVSREKVSRRKMMRGGAVTRRKKTPEERAAIHQARGNKRGCGDDGDCKNTIFPHCVNGTCEVDKYAFDFMNQRLDSRIRQLEPARAPAPSDTKGISGDRIDLDGETASASPSNGIRVKLDKFKTKYASKTEGYDKAYDEIKNDGQKKSCWSWWIWPVSVMDARGKSLKRGKWSLSNEECKFFILEPGLGDKWVGIMEALYEKLLDRHTLLSLTNNIIDADVVKKSCALFRLCAGELDHSNDIVKRVLSVSNNILEIV